MIRSSWARRANKFKRRTCVAHRSARCRQAAARNRARQSALASRHRAVRA